MPLPHAHPCAHPRHPAPPEKSRRLGRIVKEAAAKVVKKALWPIHTNLRGGPGQGVGEKGLPTLHPKTVGAQENRQPRRRARRMPLPSPGSAGFLG